MLLNIAPQNEAIISNVGEIGEFRIRNSAKAFNILSSGLYANKIRAIIRELSCNAVDSHVAANKKETPFDVHLPNTLEPWFSVRDYGTGLSHEQVTTLYTTYFESTKTDSNDYIGALGLGSKSPFSYTDNFTVTTIKDGFKGIYTAFINESGIPSIALMSSEADCEDPNGVEVKFSVDDRFDFSSFSEEAAEVYRIFKLRPNVTGRSHFSINEIEYIDKDIIPGVHTTNDRQSIAIMGNISYPIIMPNSNSNLGDLEPMLDCGLVMEFAIGELDFQASREGLSYIPQTISAIKNKLLDIQAILTIRLSQDADKISNIWERGFFLREKSRSGLWSAAVSKYVVDTKYPLSCDHNRWQFFKTIDVDVSVLKDDFNIELKVFSKHVGLKSTREETQDRKIDTTGKIYIPYWCIKPDENVYFVKADLKTGSIERTKYHWRNSAESRQSSTVYIMVPADKSQPMKTDEFIKSIYDPLKVLAASSLMVKPRSSPNLAANVTIIRLEWKNSSHYRSADMCWRDAGTLSSLSQSSVYYYLPLRGFAVESIQDTHPVNPTELFYNLKKSGLAEFSNMTVYGVRKGDIKAIEALPNWVNLELYIKSVIAAIDIPRLKELALSSLSINENVTDVNIARGVTRADSMFLNTSKTFAKRGHQDAYNNTAMITLTQAYGNNISPINYELYVNEFQKQIKDTMSQYPLLEYVNRYQSKPSYLSDYINMIDEKIAKSAVKTTRKNLTMQ